MVLPPVSISQYRALVCVVGTPEPLKRISPSCLMKRCVGWYSYPLTVPFGSGDQPSIPVAEAPIYRYTRFKPVIAASSGVILPTCGDLSSTREPKKPSVTEASCLITGILSETLKPDIFSRRNAPPRE